ncbi:unnamed protein product [Bursaphelenchus okinawaensis]|uniref:Uncharacterized protein n=1 Tax=Bursaphelenchus okinawaensis TaxID=465554 RepID=A0A811JRP1_9BILA|nr:unnamed protein product [Bursaphelenchus okinawaensis]CAG9080504.1 unnamed protein product [Bursaphelenchus okinawaensis]
MVDINGFYHPHWFGSCKPVYVYQLPWIIGHDTCPDLPSYSGYFPLYYVVFPFKLQFSIRADNSGKTCTASFRLYIDDCELFYTGQDKVTEKLLHFEVSYVDPTVGILLSVEGKQMYSRKCRERYTSKRYANISITGTAADTESYCNVEVGLSGLNVYPPQQFTPSYYQDTYIEEEHTKKIRIHDELGKNFFYVLRTTKCSENCLSIMIVLCFVLRNGIKITVNNNNNTVTQDEVNVEVQEENAVPAPEEPDAPENKIENQPVDSNVKENVNNKSIDNNENNVTHNAGFVQSHVCY